MLEATKKISTELDSRILRGDFFESIVDVESNSIPLVLVDPPYGTTSIKWDNVINAERMWGELDRVTTKDANLLFFSSQPFTSMLVSSNLDWFKYELIWNKNKCGSPGLAKRRPQKVHENILVFSKSTKSIYNPIMEKGDSYTRYNPEGYGSGKNEHGYGFGKHNTGHTNSGTRYPKSILHGSRNFSAQQTTHPTQKPTNVLAWLIMTYSNPGDLVLDFTMGTGSTGVASKMTGRRFIGIEIDDSYCDIAEERINCVYANSIGREDHQLTTQISKEMQTTPHDKHENNYYESKKLK